MQDFFQLLRNVKMEVITYVTLQNLSILLILLHSVISLPDVTSYDNLINHVLILPNCKFYQSLYICLLFIYWPVLC